MQNINRATAKSIVGSECRTATLLCNDRNIELFAKTVDAFITMYTVLHNQSDKTEYALNKFVIQQKSKHISYFCTYTGQIKGTEIILEAKLTLSYTFQNTHI